MAILESGGNKKKGQVCYCCWPVIGVMMAMLLVVSMMPGCSSEKSMQSSAEPYMTETLQNGESGSADSRKAWGAATIEELIEKLAKPTAEYTVRYMTAYTLVQQLSDLSDGSISGYFAGEQADTDSIIDFFDNYYQHEGDEYYINVLEIDEVVVCQLDNEQLKNIYDTMANRVAEKDGDGAIRAMLENECGQIKGVWQIRGDIKYRHKSKNTEIAYEQGTHYREDSYTMNYPYFPYIFQIEERYYWGFLENQLHTE